MAHVKVTAAEGISQQEIDMIMAEEIKMYEEQGKHLGELNLELAGGEIVVHSAPVSNITRVRRITGYLSNQNNFNDAKRGELRDRTTHMKIGCGCN